MVKWAARIFAEHRILVSRVFALAFLGAILVTESANEGGMLAGVLFAGGLALVGVATVGRLWCSLYISGYKDSRLITEGPYSVSRNPLYFFSLLGFAGVGLATETVTLAVALIVIAAIGYPAVIRREESALRSRFGSAFDDYAARTPVLVPSFRLFHEPESYVANPRLFRRTMTDVVWFVWLVALIEIVEAVHELHIIEPLVRLH